MAVVPLKFRCYQCNGLLGVSRSKVGTVVSCPKCGAELIVPEPVDVEVAAGGDVPGPVPAPAAVGASDTGVSFDLLDINPEDIRVEPGVDWAPGPAAEARSRSPEPDFPPIVEERPASSPPAPTEAVPLVVPPEPAPNPDAPPILIEPDRITEPRWAPPRSRDVVLPRSAVATWSLFVLIAQALAFTAGLLAGHFVWRVH